MGNQIRGCSFPRIFRGYLPAHLQARRHSGVLCVQKKCRSSANPPSAIQSTATICV